MKAYAKLANRIVAWRLMSRCSSFKGRGLSYDIIRAWFERFDEGEQRIARRFLLAVQFFRAITLHDSLVRDSNHIMAHLTQHGISPDEILVIQVDDLASSAARAVTTFRRNAKAGKKCHYCLASDTGALLALTRANQIKAIVYIDDFIGTGTQVQDARVSVTSAIGLSVAEYVIAAIVLEEAKTILDLECSVRQHYVHSRCERPLLSDCHDFSPQERSVLYTVSENVGAGHPLGYGMCASMIVLADDVPDNSPALLREALFQFA